MVAALFSHPVTRVWLLLAALTGLAWWLGLDPPSAGPDPRWLAAALLVLAFFKVRLVILHFMEIRGAPTPVRLLFEGWVVAVCTAIIAIYWIGAAAP